MALLIPEVPKDTTASERFVLERMSTELPNDWVVLHSLGLSDHPNKVWGEIDCLVLSTKGIFAVEIKGGHVSCNSGIWTFTSPNGKQTYEKKEGPFEQAKNSMFALKKVLDQDGRFKHLLLGYGVIMTYETFTTAGPEIEHGVNWDARDWHRNLGFFIGKLSSFWQESYRKKHGSERKLPTVAEIVQIRQLLRPDIASSFQLGSYLNNIEKDLIRLTNEQIKICRGMSNNPRTVIRGAAGTGKTVLAVDKAKALAEQGKRVLYLCFNRLLAEHVALNIASYSASGQITVRHAHGYFYELIYQAGLDKKLHKTTANDAEFFGKIFPDLCTEAVLSIDVQPFDVIIVDEAQDLLTGSNLDVLELLLKDGLRSGHWHFFLDPKQDIYGKLAEDAGKRLIEYGFAAYELTRNCRNTRQICIQTSIISGIDLDADETVDGPECDTVYYRSNGEFIEKFRNELRSLLGSGVSPTDIIVLSSRKFENSFVRSIESIDKLPIIDITGAKQTGGDGLHFCTMHAFKGLERQVVLAIDVDNLGDAQNAMLHYAGLSRAKALLKIFLPQAEHLPYQRQAELYGGRLSRRTRS